MEKTLKVLNISSDRKIFETGSAVSERMKDYGNLVKELHIVILTKKSSGLKEKQIAPNVWAYPTNSLSRWLYVRDAATRGKTLIFEKQFVRGEALITCQDPFECGLAGLRIKNKWHLPLEVQVHTDFFSPYFYGILNQIRKVIARKVLKHADGVRVVTQELKLKVSKLTKASIVVLPIYVDKEKIEQPREVSGLRKQYPWHFIMLAVARLTKEKNLKLALQILAKVRKKFPDTGLIIVGSGPEEKSLKALARQLAIEEAVVFAGWQEDVTSFYKMANVFIQTSIFEGYGLALIEAGLSGLPVVTTPVGIARELEDGKDAYIFSPEDREKFVGGMIDLIENNYQRENLRTNLKNFLESHLLSKSDYMAQIKDNWDKNSKKVS